MRKEREDGEEFRENLNIFFLPQNKHPSLCDFFSFFCAEQKKNDLFSSFDGNTKHLKQISNERKKNSIFFSKT